MSRQRPAQRSEPAPSREAGLTEGCTEGLVVATHGRHCLVETADGQRRICHPRGKKSQVVVGDRVLWQPTGDQGSIEHVQARRNLFYRQDEMRTKSFAANIHQALLLVAAEPEFSESQLTRALIAAQDQRIEVLIVLNKSDIQPAFERAWARLEPYRCMGYAVLALRLQGQSAASSALGLDALQTRLLGKHTLVFGPSGVGKSTLVNRLVPKARALTAEISRVLNSGKHTTTSTTWYWFDPSQQTALIDSPGFQEFGLHHIDPMQLAHLMPDLSATLGGCRFYNCTHLHEPGCLVRAHVQGQDPDHPADAAAHPTHCISPNRYRLYAELFAELSAKRRY